MKKVITVLVSILIIAHADINAQVSFVKRKHMFELNVLTNYWHSTYGILVGNQLNFGRQVRYEYQGFGIGLGMYKSRTFDGEKIKGASVDISIREKRFLLTFQLMSYHHKLFSLYGTGDQIGVTTQTRASWLLTNNIAGIAAFGTDAGSTTEWFDGGNQARYYQESESTSRWIGAGVQLIYEHKSGLFGEGIFLAGVDRNRRNYTVSIVEVELYQWGSGHFVTVADYNDFRRPGNGFMFWVEVKAGVRLGKKTEV